MLKVHKGKLDFLQNRNHFLMLIAGLLVLLAFLMLFVYSKPPKEQIFSVEIENATYRGSATGKLGKFCTFELDNGKVIVIRCGYKDFQIGQNVKLNKVKSASGEYFETKSIFQP